MARLLILDNDKIRIRHIQSLLEKAGHVSVVVSEPEKEVLLNSSDTSAAPVDLLLVGERRFLMATETLRSRFKGIPVIAMVDAEKSWLEQVIDRIQPDDLITFPLREHELLFRIDRTLESTEHNKSMTQYQQDLERVIDITSRASSLLTPRKILYHIVKEISDVIPVTRCSVMRVDSNQGKIVVLSTFENSKIHDITLDLKKYPEVNEAFINLEPVFVRNVDEDPLMRNEKEVLSSMGIRSILILPIMRRDKIVEQLFIRTSRASRPFSDMEVKFSHAIADASANAIHRAFLFDKVDMERKRFQLLAVTDPLTSLFNIRYFTRRLEQEFSRAVRHNLPLSCMMFDLDNFKEINDKYGHKCGDLVLKEFSWLLEDNFRKSDIVARYGGDEFIVLMPQSDITGGAIEAERIRKIIRNHRFDAFGRDASLSVSVGFAAFPHNKMKVPTDLSACADKALLKAKNSGRDQVAVFT